MSRTYSRQEFYDLAWSKPITHLAKDFVLSDVAIHKICRKHEIPTPPLGWWAKKAAGKPVQQTALPAPRPGISDQIVIAAAELRGETPSVAAAREHARVLASDDGAIETSEPHPIIEKTLAALRAAESGHNGLASVKAADLIHCEVAPASIDRLGRILSDIVTSAQRQGFTLEKGAVRAHFAGDGETIGFSVTEVVQRVKHVPTPAELARQEAWRRKRERRRNSWDDDGEPFPWIGDWDYVCTGRLGFEMDGVYVAAGGGPRKAFRDAKIQRLESMSSDIGVAIAVMAVAMREARERREDEERKRQEERRERERPLRAKYVAERRREALDQILDDLAGVERLRRLMDGLSALEGDTPSQRISQFLAWSRDELEEREAMFSRDGLEQRFSDDRIFGDDDDHSFKSPYWY